MSRGYTHIVATGLMTSSKHNISVEGLQESGQLESKGHLTGDVTRMDDVISVAIFGGVPHPQKFFETKMLFFTYFTKIRTHKTTKNWGRYPPRGTTPLKFFYILNSAWLGAFTRILSWLD